MESEWNLSDKVGGAFDWGFDYTGSFSDVVTNCFAEKDVKEFIRRLKEMIDKTKIDNNVICMLERPGDHLRAMWKGIHDEINKLAGEKLI